ncbi:MAG: hypothetical protein MUE71_12325 [Chitinophagaceae bacterium]|nr:hypothetical protein [Chitinophagaceae bacterium]
MQKDFKSVRIPAYIRHITRLSFLAFVSFMPFMFFNSCRQTGTKQSTIVKLYGNGSVANFSKNYYLYSTVCHLGQPGALEASPGDLFLIKNWLFKHEPSVKSTDGAIHFIHSDSILLLNGKIAGIKIDSGLVVSKLIDLGNKEAIRQLKVIDLNHEGYVAWKPELEKIALLNPGCFLMISGDFAEDELQWLFKHFDPTVLMIELREAQQHLLAGELQLQTLFLQNDDSIYHCTPLPRLPKLRDFYFSFDGNEIATKPECKNWLKENPQIRNLILTDWEEAYPKGLLSALVAPEILIMGGMKIPAEDILAHRNTLQKVILDSAELQMELPGVKHLTIFNTSDPQFFINNIPKNKPECTSLDVFATDIKLDLSPVSDLKNLQSLTLIDADSISIAPLLEMKQLKLLSYSTDSTNMDSTIAVLQTALPNTVVVANDGLCLGSGWLMAWIPALVAVMGMAVYKKRILISSS